jgi:hypothetical protein
MEITEKGTLVPKQLTGDAIVSIFGKRNVGA